MPAKYSTPDLLEKIIWLRLDIFRDSTYKYNMISKVLIWIYLGVYYTLCEGYFVYLASLIKVKVNECALCNFSGLYIRYVSSN